MDNINQEWYPDKNYLNNIKKEANIMTEDIKLTHMTKTAG